MCFIGEFGMHFTVLLWRGLQVNELLLGQHVVSEVVLYIGVLISNIVLCYRQEVCFIMLFISFCFSVFFSVVTDSHFLSLPFKSAVSGFLQWPVGSVASFI